MAFRASSVVPQNAYSTLKAAAVQLRVNLLSINSQLSSRDASYGDIQGIYMTLKRAGDQFTALSATPGIAQYAKDQEDDQAYDVVAAFTSLQSAVAAAMSWIEANVPLSVTVRPVAQWGSDDLISDTFTPAQTAGLRTQLSAVVAEIE